MHVDELLLYAQEEDSCLEEERYMLAGEVLHHFESCVSRLDIASPRLPLLRLYHFKLLKYN